MVLQEVNDSSPTADDAFSMDDRPTSTSSITGGEVTIDTSKLPGPPPLLGPLFGFTDTWLKNRLTRSVQSAENAVGRPLTQTEVDAVTYHMASLSQTAAWGDIVGAGAGYLRWRATKQEMKFPKFLFMRGTPPSNPDKFGPLVGAQARAGWQAVRLLSYSALGWALGGLAAGAYGAMTYTIKMSGDPRLTDISEALRRRAAQRNGTGLPEAQQAAQQAQRSMQTPTSQGQRRQNDYDDMSPQSGSYTDTGLMSDSQMEARDRAQRPNPRQSPTADRETTFSMDKVTRQPSGFDSDDASPTSSNSGESSSGSAWDRIRQQTASGSAGGDTARRFEQRTQARGAQSQQDSFAFSSSDEEQQLAKSEAQRDFDQRVERERQGKDFSDNSRWGR